MLDYEKVCEEGSECQLNIDQFTDNENDKDILDLLEEKGKNAKDFIFVSPCVFQIMSKEVLRRDKQGKDLRQSRKDVGSFEGLSVIIKTTPQSQELISLDRNILQIF